MPYVTSFERLGAANALIVVLRKKFDSLPQATEWRIRRLTSDQLEQLGNELLSFESLADLESWLNQHPSDVA